MRQAGQNRRDYAGMSSENPDEKSGRQKSKVSSAMLISGGLVDPKSRPRGVGDG